MTGAVLAVSVDATELQAQFARLMQLSTDFPSHLAHPVLSGFLARLEGGAVDFLLCEDVAAPGANGVHFRLRIAAVEYERLLAAFGASNA